MPPLIPQEIEDYAARHSAAESELFQRLVKETYAKATMPQMQVGRLEGAFLRLLVRLTRAKRILEIGTFTGYSALAMAEGLPEGGELITCDVNPASVKIAQKYWAQSPHGKKIFSKMGPALTTIATLKGPFDLVFIDADKENYLNYYKATWDLVPSGGLYVVDNALWGGRVLKPQETSDRAIAEFNDSLAHDQRVELVLLTVRDGVMLAYKL